jgi:hypothetical protein
MSSTLHCFLPFGNTLFGGGNKMVQISTVIYEINLNPETISTFWNFDSLKFFKMPEPHMAIKEKEVKALIEILIKAYNENQNTTFGLDSNAVCEEWNDKLGYTKKSEIMVESQFHIVLEWLKNYEPSLLDFKVAGSIKSNAEWLPC